MSKFLRSISFLTILALAIRLILALPFYSGDLNNPAIWGIYARDFGFSGFYDFLNFGNYSRPDYPPGSIFLFWFIRFVWEIIFKFFWWVNINLPIFPSNFIVWLESDGYIFLLKLPGLILDFCVGLLIYKFVTNHHSPFTDHSKKFALLAASLYWFNPATVYVSSMWGQVDGIVVFFGLASVIFALAKKYWPAFLVLTVSLLIKPTMLMIIPGLILLVFSQKTPLKKFLFSLVPSALVVYLAAYPFAPWGPGPWFFKQYFSNFLNIASNLPYIQVRAFNFWTLVTGLNFVSLTTSFWGVKLSTFAYFLFAVNFLLVAYLAFKKKNIFGAISLFIFAAFLFLPKIHERYLLPALPFMIIFCLEKWSARKKLFLAISTFLFLNLYSAWGVPRTFIVDFFRIDVAARIASFTLVLLYVYHLRLYNMARPWISR